MSMKNQANLMLLLVSAFWGLSYPILRMSVQDINGNAFVVARFALAACILLPWAAKHLRDRYALRLGATLGCVDGIICALLAFNIGHVPAARCAFVMGSSVVMVPLIAAVLGRYLPQLRDVARAGLSIAGLYILTGANIAGITVHDLWILLAAALWAFNIVILKNQTREHPMSTAAQAFYQAVFACIVPIGLLLSDGAPLGHWSLKSCGGLLYDAVFATVLTMVLQTKYQKHTTASQAGLRMSLEPLFASFFAVSLFGEHVTRGMLAGAPLMITAIMLPEIQAWIAQRKATRALRERAREAARNRWGTLRMPRRARRHHRQHCVRVHTL